jgi:dTDP-4-dehydrorhamnose 3,5-epimerase
MATTEQGSKDWIGSDFRDQATTQSYGGSTPIEGIRFFDLRLFSDEGGDFCELCRFNPDGTLQAVPEFRAAQTSYSYMEPGTIKAWHLHRQQEDLWFVPPYDRCLVGLLDVREASPTYKQTMRFALGVGRARLLLIPRGVAHGVANLTSLPASMIYFVNRAFDPENPDEHRMPWDLLGAQFWSNEAN